MTRSVLLAVAFAALLLAPSPVHADESTVTREALDQALFMGLTLHYAPWLTAEGAPWTVNGRSLVDWVITLNDEGAAGDEAEIVLGDLRHRALPALAVAHAAWGTRARKRAAKLAAPLLPTTIEELRRLIVDRRPYLRLLAANALGRAGVREAISPLLVGLGDEDPFARTEAAWALGELGGFATPEVMERLTARLETEDDISIEFIALTRMGASGMDAARRVLADPERRAKSLLLQRMAGEPAAVTALATMLDAQDAHLRAWAARRLGEAAHLPASLVSPLLACLDDESGAVAWHAVWALRRVEGSLDDAVHAPLRRLLGRADHGLRGAAAVVLVEAGARDGILAQPLVDVLGIWRNPSQWFPPWLGSSAVTAPVSAAVEALGRLGAPAAHLLEGVLADGSELACLDALDALALLGEAGLPGLRRALDDERDSVAERAALALLESGEASAAPVRTALASLQRYPRTTDDDDRVIDALVAPGAAVVPFLADAAAQGGAPTPTPIVRVLVRLGPIGAPALPDLLRLEGLAWGGSLEDGGGCYPPSAEEWFLGQMVDAMGEAAVLALTSALDDEDVEIRHRALRLLLRLGEQAKAAGPAIRRAAAAGRIQLDDETLEALGAD